MLRQQNTSKTGAAPTTAYCLRNFETTNSVDANPHASAGNQTDVTIVLGRTRMTSNEASNLQAGSLVMLEQDVADPVEIYSGGRLVGWGQVVVIDDKFCVRVVELKAAEQAA